MPIKAYISIARCISRWYNKKGKTPDGGIYRYNCVKKYADIQGFNFQPDWGSRGITA